MTDTVKDAIDQGADAANFAADSAANQAKSTTDQFRDQAQSAREAFSERVVDPAKRAGEAIKESGQRMAQGGTTIGARMIDQAEQNTHAAFAAMRQAAAAKDLSDVMRIQGDFLREQGNRGMSQAREIGELIMQFGRDAVAPLRGDKG